ncbi:MAG: hypothetical protein JWO76_1737, partial [Nocardioides sp.]|nr:hypothetical protein [Nocardioides sp.]
MTAPRPDTPAEEQRWRDPHPGPATSATSGGDRARAVGRGLGAGA